MIRRDFSLAKFREYVSDKRCICIGAGLQGLHIIYLFENWKISKNILAFADNNPEKWDGFYEVEDYSYPIISVEDVIKIVDEDIVLIITCADVTGIEKQLNKYPELKNIVCFSLAEIAQRQLLVSDYENVINEYKEALIPKKIHYCWFGKEMPKTLKDNVEKWHNLCPDYEFIEWNENNYDVRKNAYISEAYDAKKWAFISDYTRLDVVYKYGGIYMDTDVALLKKPDKLLYQRGFVISDCSFFINLGAGFGAAPGNPIIKEFRDYYENIHIKKPEGKFDMTACQIHQYRVLRKHNIQLMDKVQNIGEINVYPMIMASTNTYSMQMKLSDKAFFAHYGVSAWMSEEHKEQKKEVQKKGIEGLINYSF